MHEAAGTADRAGIEIGGVQLHVAVQRGDGDTDCAGAAAEVKDYRSPSTLRCDSEGLADEELAASTRHEDAVADMHPHTAQLDTTQHLLERPALDPLLHQALEPVRVVRLLQEQDRLVLGVHAPRGAQPLGELRDLPVPGRRRLSPSRGGRRAVPSPRRTITVNSHTSPSAS